MSRCAGCDRRIGCGHSHATRHLVRLLDDLQMYGRFARGLRTFLRQTVSPEGARASLAQRLAAREDAFLRMLDRGFFGAPRSPYRALFALAGCEPGDVRALVRERGVDGALRNLREAGVYFTFEEYKGRQPVVRYGREITVADADFDNPYLTRAYENSTSGSTGPRKRVSTDLDLLAVAAEHRLIFLEAHGLHDVPLATWRPPLPGSGLNVVLRAARAGRPIVRWFTPVVQSDLRPELRFRLANQATVALGRAFGAALPWPEPIPVTEAIRIARWMADTCRESGGAVLTTTVSGGLRVALAAREAGIDLTGATLFVAGEPPTAAKVRGIRESGARHITDYGMADAGRVAVGCANPADENDLHVLLDAYHVVPGPRHIPQSGETVTSFYITSLLPATPKLLLNVEFDDCGIIEERQCGCPLERLGLTTHLREVRSFGKLVTEGVALLSSDMLRILEEDLPREFGGSPLDYQLAEEEDDTGFTRLTLLVSPRVGPVDEARLIATVLAALRHGSVASDVARAFWETAGTFRVRREEPFVSARGKQSPLRRLTSRAAGTAR